MYKTRRNHVVASVNDEQKEKIENIVRRHGLKSRADMLYNLLDGFLEGYTQAGNLKKQK